MQSDLWGCHKKNVEEKIYNSYMDQSNLVCGVTINDFDLKRRRAGNNINGSYGTEYIIIMTLHLFK